MVYASAIRIQSEKGTGECGAGQRLAVSFEIRLSYVACGYWEAHGTASSNEREQVILASEVRGGGMVKGCPAGTPWVLSSALSAVHAIPRGNCMNHVHISDLQRCRNVVTLLHRGQGEC